jgi:bacterioferritin (cytochrome b1)
MSAGERDDTSNFDEEAMTEKKQNPETESTTPTAAAQPARRALLESGTALAASLLLGGAASALAGCGDDDDIIATGGSGGKGGSSAGSGGVGGKTGGSGGTGGSTSGGNGGQGGSSGPAADADIAPLNALLNAEYTAIAAYSAGAQLITDAPSSDPLSALKDVIKAIAVDIQSQHKLHAAELVKAIDALSGTPVQESTVADAFKAPDALANNPTITNVLKFAAGAERGAAIAYNQTVAGLEDAQYRFLAASIGGDESQHFIVLASLVAGLAGPGAKLSVSTAGDVVPQAFVSTVDGNDGLDKKPDNYFA